ncbi:MAG TPA: ABC transporter ATP-binding protein [Cyclobacteriaceae bacterium]|nr:ABC transporter ATP-binding protein [Cyclobacteriaceae bacterium]
MKVVAENLGKRFNREWIFRHFTLTIEPGKTYAITGPNGSGKSTLSQVLWGQVPPTAGTIKYISGDALVQPVDLFKHVSIATPYMELVEEFTLDETIEFHFKFKTPQSGIPVGSMAEQMGLSHARDKKIAAFSSGMKQRVKLALAFYSDTPLLFLDEPTTNLDKRASAWYQDNLKRQSGRTIVIASNQEEEYPSNSIKIDLSDYKAGLQNAARTV